MTTDRQPADVWIPSRFNLAVGLEKEQKIVANLFTGEVSTVAQQTWDQFLRPGREHPIRQEAVSEVLRDLFFKGFLVTKSVDEREPLRLHFQQYRFSAASARVAIATTMGCNLHCPYCFEGNARYARESAKMSRETEAATTRFLVELGQGREKLVVNWYGGEPLVGLSCIEAISKEVIPALEKEGCAYAAIITSNGVLLRDGVAARLRELRVHSCQVSVDIPCANKVDGRGREVQETQLDNLLTASASLKIKLRINVATDDEDQFDLLYRRLLDRGLQSRIDDLSFAPITPVERPADASFGLLTGESLRRVLRREVAKAEKLGFSLMKFRPGIPAPCGATCNGSMLIGPDGSVYKCPADLGKIERAFSSVHSERPMRPGNLIPWLTYDWFQHKECQDCPILPTCAGGCPHRRMHGYSKAQYCELLLSDYRELWLPALRELASNGDAVSTGGRPTRQSEL